MDINRTNFNGSAADVFHNGYESWSTILVVCEAISIVFAMIAFWTLVCVVIYGTKTGRWKKKRGASSLNSGMIYITCTVLITLVTARLVAMEILYQATRMGKSSQWCNAMCHAITISYGICTYAAYFFVCTRQRLIYANPFVKGKLGKFAISASWLAFLLLSAAFVALGCLYVLPVSYEKESYGCVLAPPKSDGFLYNNTSDVLLGITFVLIQTLLLCLVAYPAVRVKFDVSADLRGSTKSNRSSETEADYSTTAGRPFSLRCKELFVTSGEAGSSPIKMAVRRSLIASIVLVVTAVILVAVDMLLVSRDFPVAVAQTIYDIGSMVNIFVVLSTFGFAGDILTLLCPKIKMSRGRRAQTAYIHGEEKSPGENV